MFLRCLAETRAWRGFGIKLQHKLFIPVTDQHRTYMHGNTKRCAILQRTLEWDTQKGAGIRKRPTGVMPARL